MQATAKKQNEKKPKTMDAKKPMETFNALRKSWGVNLVFFFVVPFVALLCCEWTARGTLAGNDGGNGFIQAAFKHFPSFFIAFLLLLALYVLLVALVGNHLVSSIVVSVVSFAPAVVTYFKLTLRGEPFLPWDFSQIDELMSISGSVELEIPLHMVFAALFLILVCVAAAFVQLPQRKDWLSRVFLGAGSVGCALLLLFGVFLNTAGSHSLGIWEDSWMQDRYYRNHGVITGFLTNLQMLDIEKPSGYDRKTVEEILTDTLETSFGREPLYANSYVAGEVEQPVIIFVMAESFWDVTQLEGIEYDQPITPNLERLALEGAYGYAYTPSFGGGTCDVEFEALTGFSMEHLPSGAKPYQQYVTQKTFSLPNYLKEQGYSTAAIHGYGAKFWSRDTAYPNLGFDEFISSADFEDPIYRRGFISDESMVDRILEEYNSEDGPQFIHAVTMQNHTTYSRDRYPESYLVNVMQAPEGLSDSVIGQLEDCATGIRDMDAAIGKLCDEVRESERPTIVVFWGDHLNPMSDGYSLFEQTGYIDKGDNGSPELHKTPLLIWSNYHREPIDLGIVSTYNITPVMMDIYGLEMPVYYEFLLQQMEVLPTKTRGVIVNPNGSYSWEMSEEQEDAFHKKSVLQYDLLFGSGYTWEVLAQLGYG